MTPFDAAGGLIVVPVQLAGPAGTFTLRVAIDTGATNTLISTTALTFLGYDLAAQPRAVSVLTASGVESAVLVATHRLSALGRDRVPFDVVAHTLPPGGKVDGLLGLDFFRGAELVIDFRAGVVRLT